MRAKQRRRKEAAAEAALAEKVEVHEVNVDEAVATAENDLADVGLKPLREKILSLEGLLKGEQTQLNKLRADLVDEKEAHGVSVAYEKRAAEEAIAKLKKANETAFVALYGDLDGQVEVARAALAEIVDDVQARLILGTGAIFDAVVEAIALRVQTLPQGPWGPKEIAERIRDNAFEHPVGVRDFYPVIGENGYPVEVDGEEVEQPEYVAFKEQAKKIIQEAKKACRKLHRMKLENDRMPVIIVMGQPWYL